MVVYYEEIVRAPHYWFKEMQKFSGIRFDLRYANELSPRYITISEELRDAFVERLDRLGLLSMVEEFYPPEMWF